MRTTPVARWRIGLLALTGLLLIGSCAPGIEDPAPFNDPELCNYDVVEELLVPTCGRTSGCHSPTGRSNGLDFVTGGLAERLVGVDSTVCPGTPRVDPSSPDDSLLLMMLDTEMHSCGGSELPKMPQNGAPLAPEDLECVRQWVNHIAGAPARDAGPPFDAGPRTDAGPLVDAGPEVDAGSLPDAGGLSVVEIEAESMTLGGSYMIDGATPTLIRIADAQQTGTATADFTGAPGAYMLTLEAVAEDDGQPMIVVRIAGQMVAMETFPLGNAGQEPITLGPYPVTMAANDTIEVTGTQAADTAWARLDKLVFTP